MFAFQEEEAALVQMALSVVHLSIGSECIVFSGGSEMFGFVCSMLS